MAEENNKLHIVMFPWLAFGHLIPYFELSKCLAQMGHLISLISAPRNIDRLPPVPDDLLSLMKLVKLTPPHIDELPEEAQSTIDVPVNHIHYIRKLLDGLEGPFAAFLEGDPSPDWVIYDLFVYWAPRVAGKFGIPAVFFCPCTAATLSIVGPPSALMDSELPPMIPEQLTVTPPWIPFPTKVAYRYHEAVHIVEAADGGASGVDERRRLGLTFQGCNSVAIRSCPEFEPEWIQLLSELFGKPVFPVGLLSPSVHGFNGSRADKGADQEWLDGQKHGSAVYVAFGSELRLSREQVEELAFGLELSELPFFWAYRGEPGFLPEGFEGRTNGRGLIRTGWASQAQLLAHASIGCFLMHAGWGSASECLAHGKPLVMLPMIGDQGVNARLLEEKKVGIEVARNEMDGSFTREAVAKCLRLVMVDDEGGPIRSNAREMTKSFGNKKQNDECVAGFVNYLISQRGQKPAPAPAT